jgi:hypothetical protein
LESVISLLFLAHIFFHIFFCAGRCHLCHCFERRRRTRTTTTTNAMKVATKTNISTANCSGKGFRQSKAKAPIPPVTSIVWGNVTQAALGAIARQKLGIGKTSPLPTSTDEVNKIAFSCYSAKELPFVLQGLGFAGSSYPTKKAELVKLAVSTFRAVSHLKNGDGAASSTQSNGCVSVTATRSSGSAASAAASGSVSVTATRSSGSAASAAASGSGPGTSDADIIDVDSSVSAVNHSPSVSLVSISPTAATKKQDATDGDFNLKSSLGNGVTSSVE